MTSSVIIATAVLISGAAAAPSRDARIVNGQAAKIENFPWVAQLHMSLLPEEGKEAAPFEGQCGGSLITPTWILTAAHCVEGLVEEGAPGRVVLGTVDSCMGATADGEQQGYSFECEGETIFEIKRIVAHPNYNTCNMRNDIALIELKTSVPTSVVDAPVAISNSYSKPGATLTADEEKVVALGWGSVKNDGYGSEEMMKVYLEYMTRATVETMDSPNAPDPLNIGMIGAYAQDKDTCQGDSGGPLFNIAAKEQVGVVSFGDECAKKNSPGIYAEVGFYYDWIAGYTDGYHTDLNGAFDNKNLTDYLGEGELDLAACPSSGGLSFGALIGIIVGSSVVGLIIIIVIVVICCCKKDKVVG